ncbi:MAG: hypothetical protein R3E76_16535 [Planctomycetota bacterium]
MASVALKCPSCGATESVAAPHGMQICEFCGTRYQVQVHVVQQHVPETPDETPEQARQWLNLGIILTLLFVAAVVGFGIMIGLLSSAKDRPPSHLNLAPYNTPRH